VHVLLQLYRAVSTGDPDYTYGLANYAHRLGLAPKMNPTRRFTKIFCNNIAKSGRVNEAQLSLRLNFMDGFKQGVRNAVNMRNIGLGMLGARRLNPLTLLGN